MLPVGTQASHARSIRLSRPLSLPLSRARSLSLPSAARLGDPRTERRKKITNKNKRLKKKCIYSARARRWFPRGQPRASAVRYPQPWDRRRRRRTDVLVSRAPRRDGAMDGWMEGSNARESEAVVGTLRVRPLPLDVSSTRPHCVLLPVTPPPSPLLAPALCQTAALATPPNTTSTRRFMN